MTAIDRSLQELGFSKKEAGVYLTLLEIGEGTVTDIAKQSRFRRTTIHNILPVLIERGVIAYLKKRKRKYYYVSDTKALMTDIESKSLLLKKLLPELQAIHNIIPNKPKIRLYEGLGGMKEFYRDTIDSVKSGDTIYSYTGLSDFYRLMPPEISRPFIDRRIEKKVKIRIITGLSEASIEWQKTAALEMREIKISKKKYFKFNADMEIYGNKVALISYKENFMGVVIESSEISAMLRVWFEMTWEYMV